jgi:two-component system CheB/CheR fusion protein
MPDSQKPEVPHGDNGQSAAAPLPAETDSATAPATATTSAPAGALPPLPFPVVAIGASAGGLAALEGFFSAMPLHDDTGMAFVVVQHLAPDHRSLLVELIQRYTRMPVIEAADGMALAPDHVYTIPPNHDLRMGSGALQLAKHAPPRGLRLTVDHFFASLARAQRERAIAIVLSGAGSDGTLGARAVKAEGGLVIAQLPDTTEHDGMPRSAIATGIVDYVLAPADMPAQLMAYVRHAFDPLRRPPAAGASDGVLRKVCLLLRAQTGHDFTQYKETTILRRMERRMALQQIADAEDYLRYARENPAEVEALFGDLLIGVTNFFRDPEAFKVLEEQVIPRILAEKPPHEPLRVWVCGCSTGEEAYSIAILLHERMQALKRPLRVQVFATDIDQRAIEFARAGVYPASIAADISEERLARFFVNEPQGSNYRIQKHIRDLLVFSAQDVTKDPPFSRLDLVSCRNLLIYLNAEVQKRLIPLFHYALAPGGALFLGTSESLGEAARLFTPVDRKWKLYFRLPSDTGPLRPALPAFVPAQADGHREHGGLAGGHGQGDHDEPGSLREVTERALLAHYGPAALLINARGQILHILGRTGQFLEPAAGDAAMNILPMAREGLRRELTIALHKAVAHRETVRYEGLRVQPNGHPISVRLTLRPVEVGSGSSASLLYLVVLEEQPERAAGLEGPPEPDASIDDRIAALEAELRSKDEYLQTTLEEMETTNEELKSTNEEMQSVNEELQSTNEELETSKEELQSVNEELSTVNMELQDKVLDLSRANNDMNNLLAGTGVGTLFVDHQLRIARFTPAATQVFNLIQGDVGRPLEHVVHNALNYSHLADDVRTVLDTLVPQETEVQVKGGAWYLLRIRPYRTTENLIEGAVITLVDISTRMKTEESLRRSEARLTAFIRQAYAGIGEADLDGRFLFANDRLCELLGYTRDELLQRRLRDVTDPEDLPAMRKQIEGLVADGPDFQLDVRCVRKNGSRLWTHERLSLMRDGRGQPMSLLLLCLDASERSRAPAASGSAGEDAVAREQDALAQLQALAQLDPAREGRDAALLRAVDAALVISGADMGEIRLFGPDAHTLESAAQRNLDERFVTRWTDAGGAWGTAVAREEKTIIEDVQHHDAFADPQMAATLREAGVRALTGLALAGRGGQRHGLLLLAWRQPARPEERTLRLLQLLLRQVADMGLCSTARAPNLEST